MEFIWKFSFTSWWKWTRNDFSDIRIHPACSTILKFVSRNYVLPVFLADLFLTAVFEKTLWYNDRLEKWKWKKPSLRGKICEIFNSFTHDWQEIYGSTENMTLDEMFVLFSGKCGFWIQMSETPGKSLLYLLQTNSYIFFVRAFWNRCWRHWNGLIS